MSKTKRYFWLKLKEDFFEEDTIAWLEEQEKGKEYALFYLKLCLKSLKTDGYLIRKVGQLFVPYDAKKLAEITNTDFDTVLVAMEILKKIGLVEIMENGEIYLTQLANMVGSETSKASLMRKSRAQKALESGNGNNVTPMLPLPSNIVDTEIEKELEKELEKDIFCPNSENLDEGEQIILDDSFSETAGNFIVIDKNKTVDAIYKMYPLKKGKADGVKHTLGYLCSGRQITGIGNNVKYNHEQIRCAILEYVEDCKKNNIRYYQYFGTFMNNTVNDFIEQSKNRYEQYMQKEYGNEWRNIKFTYK